MSTATRIEWTDTTWNPVVGCTPVSPGCLNCYAATFAGRGLHEHYVGLTVRRQDKLRDGERARTRAVFNGVVRMLPEKLTEPLHWRRPRRVFVNSMSDLFHESVPFEFIAAVYGVMGAAPEHTFQVLTKRPGRAIEFYQWLGGLSCGRTRREAKSIGPGQLPLTICGAFALKAIGERISVDERFLIDMLCRDRLAGSWPLPNVWMGTSVEDQPRADERIPWLLRCPAAVRFLSVEPMLSHVDVFGPIRDMKLRDVEPDPGGDGRYLHWVIVGGESGAQARPCNVAWVRSVVEQCRDAGVPVFVKQLGRAPVEDLAVWQSRPFSRLLSFSQGKRLGLLHSTSEVVWEVADKKGGDMAEWPEDLRVREFPEARS